MLMTPFEYNKHWYDFKCVKWFNVLFYLVDAQCARDDCLNNAFCESFIDGPQCTCAAGFTGDRCETNIMDCQDTSCANGGTCVDLVNDYACICKNGYQGIKKEVMQIFLKFLSLPSLENSDTSATDKVTKLARSMSFNKKVQIWLSTRITGFTWNLNIL